MAANYSASIQLIVEGQQKLDKLQSQVTALNKQIKELARLDIKGVFEDPLMGGAVAKLRAARNEQIAALKQTGQQQDAVNRKLESQLLNQIRLNSAVDLYKRRVNEVSRTAAPEQVQFKGRIQELEQAFQFFKGKGSVQGVQAVATELGRIVEYSREVTRLELGRVKSSQQIKDYTAQIEKLKAAGLNTTKAEVTLEKFAVNAGTNKYQLAEKYKVILDSRLKTLAQELRLQKEIAAAEARKGRNVSNRTGNAVSSAIIGGGFPLLFGQGPAAAAGGALGGVAGGLLGGGFGFALSIAGTAIGDFIAQTDTLNVTLAGLNATITSTGTASITTASDISQLAKNLQITKEEAIDLVRAFNQFNNGNIRESLARGFGTVGGAQTFEAIARAGLGEKEALDAIFSLRKQIGNEAAEQLALQLNSVGATETQAALLKIVSERNIEILVAQSKTVQFTDRLLSAWENIVAALASAVSLAIRFIAKMQEGSLIKLPFLDRIQQVLGKTVGRTSEQIAGQRGANLEQQLRKELDDLRKALGQETRAQGVQASLAESLKPERGGKSAAEREAERLAQQRQKQLEVAARMAVLTEGELQKAVATTEVEKLNTDYAQQRMERMVKYETLYKEALSSAEIEYLLMAQSNEIMAENVIYQEKVLEIEKQQTAELYNQLNAASILDKQVQKRLRYGIGEGSPAMNRRLTGAAGIAFTPGVSLMPSTGLAAEAEQVKAELDTLLNPINQITTAAEGIGSAFSESFKGIVSGTMTAQEALASFFQNVADQFLSMAAQIIAKWIEMAILNTVLSLFPSTNKLTGSAASGGYTLPSGGGFADGFSLPSIGFRANGGSVMSGSPYIVGERGPELFVPGKSGTIVPNNQLTGDNVSVVVNVDAKGTSVEGNTQTGNQLGSAISAAVQQELIKQKRPGGLLA